MINSVIDVNVSVGFWPFQAFVVKDTHCLSEHMKKLKIDYSLVSAIESVLYPDPDVYDTQCFKELKKYPNLLPVKTVNPVLANWRESLLQFVNDWNIRAIKIFPNFHNYSVNDAELEKLAKFAGDLNLPVLIPLRICDERQQHWIMDIKPVPFNDVIELAEKFPETNFIILNAYSWEATSIPETMSNMYSDFSFGETADTLYEMTYNFNPKSIRFLFGSATPFLTTEAAFAKLHGGTAAEEVREQILANGRKLFNFNR